MRDAAEKKVLGALSHGGWFSTSELIQRKVGKFSDICVVLARLEDATFVESRVIPADYERDSDHCSVSPSYREYHITDAGAGHWIEWQQGGKE